MKYTLHAFCILMVHCCFLPSAYSQQATNTKTTMNSLTTYVNPFIGTGGHGHTFPGPTMPFGACQVGPDTRLEGWDGCSGYHFSDTVIYGFSHTHLSGTGCSDYGDILLMPVTKNMPLYQYQYASHFSHTNEKAQAGYYQVFLDDPKVNVELTSTLHGGVHRYTFQPNDEQYVILDLKHRDQVLDSKMEKIDDYTLRGYRFSKAWAQNQKVFFEITFSKPIEWIQYEAIAKGSNTTAVPIEKSLHCIIHFQQEGGAQPDQKATKNPLQLITKVSISGVDEDGAHKNMLAEMPDWNFDNYHTLAQKEWEKELSKIQITQTEGSKHDNHASSVEQLTIFYTALYHCMIHPSIYNDVDGRYRGRDDKIHNTEGLFDYYTVFSLWDTYRALHPLLTIIDKKRSNDFINTFIKQYEQGGRLPIWELSSNETNCMIGYHVVSVIWDTYQKGMRGFDAEKAYEAMTKIATHYTDYEGEGLSLKLKESARKGAADADALESYCKYGYVRSDDSHESVSKTLEYAYDDWCIAQMANALGKKKDYVYYTNRSQYWKNVYDPSTGFMRARKNGCLYEPFSPYTVDNNYTEANAWQYSFSVPHDLDGLMEIMQGGSDYFKKKLNELFAAKTQTQGREQADITGLIGQYAHGNEPSHHIAYLYNSTTWGEHHTTAITNQIAKEFYKNSPDGLIGNEDCGQMSAWYVFKGLGFYPTCPGDYTFQITEPLFNHIQLNNGLKINKKDTSKIDNKTFCVEANRTDITYDDLVSKKNIQMYAVEMKHQPGCWFPNEKKNNTIPFIKNGIRIFKDSTKIEMMCAKPGNAIFYSLNDAAFKKYEKPFFVHEQAEIVFFNENNKSMMQTATFTKLPGDRKIILHNQYNPSYSAGGAEALMDGLYGKLNWRAGDWQGYQGQDVEVIMAFDKPRAIKKIAANFLEDQNSWIFYPKEVSFYVSNDSTQWTLIENIATNKSDHAEKTSISMFETSIRNIKKEHYRYAKVIAKNFGPMPQWHEGRGNPTFVFLDEFIVE
jgi:predicted alpha-1,2-mannosidase